jgi:hypothetical protein
MRLSSSFLKKKHGSLIPLHVCILPFPLYIIRSSLLGQLKRYPEQTRRFYLYLFRPGKLICTASYHHYNQLNNLKKLSYTSSLIFLQSHKYQNFNKDFGPLHLGEVYRFVNKIESALRICQKSGTKVVVYTGANQEKKANSVFLVCSFMVTKKEIYIKKICNKSQ